MSTYTRESLIGDAEKAIEWLRASSRGGFFLVEFREAMDWKRHKAARWLRAAEARGIVEHLGRSRGWRFVPPEVRQSNTHAA